MGGRWLDNIVLERPAIKMSAQCPLSERRHTLWAAEEYEEEEEEADETVEDGGARLVRCHNDFESGLLFMGSGMNETTTPSSSSSSSSLGKRPGSRVGINERVTDS